MDIKSLLIPVLMAFMLAVGIGTFIYGMLYDRPIKGDTTCSYSPENMNWLYPTPQDADAGRKPHGAGTRIQSPIGHYYAI